MVIPGTLVSIPLENEVGFIEINSGDHADSYLVLYNYSDYPEGKLFDEIYLKVIERKNLAFAKAITTEKPAETYHGSIRTKISYHSFSKHGLLDGYHRRGHILGGSFSNTSNGNATVNVYDIENRDTITVEVVSDQKQNVINMSDRNVYMNIAEETYNGEAVFLLTSIDTCHIHGDRIIDCLD